MMFEKLTPRENGGAISRTAYRLFDRFDLFHKEVDVPFIEEIDGQVVEFHKRNTRLFVCKEDSFYSCIVQLVEGAEGEEDAEMYHTYHQPELMERLEAAGFRVYEENLEEARQAYEKVFPDSYWEKAA